MCAAPVLNGTADFHVLLECGQNVPPILIHVRVDELFDGFLRETTTVAISTLEGYSKELANGNVSYLLPKAGSH